MSIIALYKCRCYEGEQTQREGGVDLQYKWVVRRGRDENKESWLPQRCPGSYTPESCLLRFFLDSQELSLYPTLVILNWGVIFVPQRTLSNV